MHIDFDQLIAFERIAREGSFTGAAWSLDIPQPTLSARIKTLEQTLGAPLFQRRGRQVTLTDLGQAFLPYVQRTIAVLGEGIEVAQQADQGQRGRLTYGGLYSLAGALLGPAIARFYAAHPQVDLIIQGGYHQGVVDWVRDRIVELGLIIWPCPESAMTPMEPLLRLRESVVLAVGADHPLARRGEISHAELLDAADPLLSVALWASSHHTVIQIASEAKRSIRVPLESARHIARAGAGVGFFTRVYILDDLASGALVELKIHDLKPLYRETALVRLPRTTPLNAAAEQFVQCLRFQALQLGIEVVSSAVEERQ